jgi:hypothetical protein
MYSHHATHKIFGGPTCTAVLWWPRGAPRPTAGERRLYVLRTSWAARCTSRPQCAAVAYMPALTIVLGSHRAVVAVPEAGDLADGWGSWTVGQLLTEALRRFSPQDLRDEGHNLPVGARDWTCRSRGGVRPKPPAAAAGHAHCGACVYRVAEGVYTTSLTVLWLQRWTKHRVTITILRNELEAADWEARSGLRQAQDVGGGNSMMRRRRQQPAVADDDHGGVRTHSLPGDAPESQACIHAVVVQGHPQRSYCGVYRLVREHGGLGHFMGGGGDGHGNSQVAQHHLFKVTGQTSAMYKLRVGWFLHDRFEPEKSLRPLSSGAIGRHAMVGGDDDGGGGDGGGGGGWHQSHAADDASMEPPSGGWIVAPEGTLVRGLPPPCHPPTHPPVWSSARPVRVLGLTLRWWLVTSQCRLLDGTGRQLGPPVRRLSMLGQRLRPGAVLHLLTRDGLLPPLTPAAWCDGHMYRSPLPHKIMRD